MLKGVIGKDLLDADLPISQYAPFTALHARCAELECTRLLDQVSPTCTQACWKHTQAPCTPPPQRHEDSVPAMITLLLIVYLRASTAVML